MLAIHPARWGFAALLLLVPGLSGAATIDRERYLMGTTLSLTLEGPNAAKLEEAASAAFQEVARLEGRLSNWSAESEVSRVNAGETEIGPELREVIERGQYWSAATGGTFDIALEPLLRSYDSRGEGRWPSKAELDRAMRASGFAHVHLDSKANRVRLDPGAGIETGGIGKGHALDRAAAVLRSRGVSAALLNFGGQVLAIGAPAGEPGWKILLSHPDERERVVAEVILRDASLSTSAQTERSVTVDGKPLGHILDPRIGLPAPSWGSASAVTRTGTDADALSTAFFVLGPDGAARWIADYGRRSDAVPVAALTVEGAPGGPVKFRQTGRCPGLISVNEIGGDTVKLASAEQDPAAGGSGSTATPDNAELARRIDILAEEIENMRQGEGVSRPESQRGMGPAASRVYGASPGLSLGGYGEGIFQHQASEDESGNPTLARDQFDWLRAVGYVGYKFTDKMLFNSEVEVEHASTGEGAEEKGEISVEFAYLDFLLHRRANARAGLLLVPVGWINELHEPPTFLGSLRPDVETFILPSTWRAGGLGLHGDLGSGLSYRAYLLEGLRAKADEEVGADGFSADRGIRGGRQGGSNALVENWAGAARADWRSRLGLTLGASLYSGGSGQGDTAPTPGGDATFTARTTVAEGHAEYRARGAWLRALYAHVSLDDADLVNAANGLSGDESVGSSMFGWYGEAGYDVGRLFSKRESISLYPFVRYEAYDTQKGVPAGFLRNPANDRTTLTAGAVFYPHPQVALKADYQSRKNKADTGVNQWNVSLSYLF